MYGIVLRLIAKPLVQFEYSVAFTAFTQKRRRLSSINQLRIVQYDLTSHELRFITSKITTSSFAIKKAGLTLPTN